MEKIWIGLLLVVGIACGTEQGKHHKKVDMEETLEAFEACKATNTEKRSCREFTARFICSTFGIADFVKEDGSYIKHENVEQFILSSAQWETLGNADIQEVLDDAQRRANQGTAVVVVAPESEGGSIVLIVPGEQEKSGSWGGLNCPNSACVSVWNPKKSYLNKKLSYAWSTPKDLMVYYRLK